MSYFASQTTRFDPSYLSGFGTLETAELTPILQLDFVYGINSQTGVASTANSATVDTDSSRLRLTSGTNGSGSAVFQSRRPGKYRAGQGVTARFTYVFGTAQANNTQLVGPGNAVDGYFFGYNGTSFGICHMNRTTPTWTAQAAFNGDTINGTGASGFTINPQYGNVYMIKYPYLGYGDILFFVLHPTTGRWILVHTIQYPNTTIVTQLGNPNLSFYTSNVNSGNTVSVVSYCGSVGFFLSGVRSFVANPKWSYDNSKSPVSTETSLFGIRNATSYNGIVNRSLVRLNSVSFASSAASNGSSTLRLRLNTGIGGVPVYNPVSGTTADNGVTITSGNSVASVDVAGTTVSGGTLLYSIVSTAYGEQTIDLTPYDIYLAPGEIMSVCAFSTTNTIAAAALNWTEDV